MTDSDSATVVQPIVVPEISRKNPLWATGRRKTAIASVRFIPGGGRILVNGESVAEYFAGHHNAEFAVMQPLRLTNIVNSHDIYVKVAGGGITGQAEAIRLGLSRALVKLESKLKPIMRKEGFLTRDPRMVERKKPGQPKARRRFQHSKR